jgi:hypothetical protein
MSKPRLILPFILLVPALAAAQSQPADQPPAAPAASVIQPGAAQALTQFFGASALEHSSVPPAGAAVPLEASRKPKPVPTPHAGGGGPRATPDWSFTPGKLCSPSDPGFSEYRYAENIPYCTRNVTEQMKQEVGAHYGVPQSEWSGYEFDHLIPLSIGGDSHVDNLWPQPHGGGSSDPDGSYGKDKLEMQLYLQMKAGSMKQAEAIQQIQLWFDGQSEIDTGKSPMPVPPGGGSAD